MTQKITFSAVKSLENEYAMKDGSFQAPVISTESLSVTSYEGTTAVLPCDAMGDPKPIIKWSYNGKELPGRDGRFVVLGDGSLQITNVKTSDCGAYRCSARNDAGTDDQAVELTVRGTEEATKKPNLWASPGRILVVAMDKLLQWNNIMIQILRLLHLN